MTIPAISAQAERVERARELLDELSIALVATAMVIEAIRKTPAALRKPNVTAENVVDHWRGANLLLLTMYTTLHQTANQAIGAVIDIMKQA